MRSAVVLVEAGRVALIDRTRGDEKYYVFPGGTVEDAESCEDAAIREAFEELGLRVRLERLVAVVTSNDRQQHYYSATSVGGTFGRGKGPEFAAGIDPSRGSYRPVWLKITEISNCDVRPRSLAQLLVTPGLEAIDEVINVLD